MSRHTAVAAALSLVLALSATGCAPMYSAGGPSRTYMGFAITVGDAPPPPRLYFADEPRFVFVGGVRIVDAPDPDCDLFYYGGAYWLYRSGYWYRSRAYDGSYVAVEVRRVPRAVLEVPPKHWRHHPGRGRALGHEKRGHPRGRW